MATKSGNTEHKDIESAIAILHDEIVDVKADTANESIEEWIDFLKEHKDEGIKEILASLKELKKLLKGKKSDATEICEVLKKLGEQTNALGDDAERGVKGPMHTLGKALITFSNKIERAAKEK
jgi:allophanate hydrolase subunit 1